MAFPRPPMLLLVLIPLATTAAAHGQQLVPSSNGFSYGTSSGISSFYRQENRSSASVLQQVLTMNVSPLEPGSELFRIDSPLKSFSVIEVRQNQSAGDSQTTVGVSLITGNNFSVFSN